MTVTKQQLMTDLAVSIVHGRGYMAGINIDYLMNEIEEIADQIMERSKPKTLKPKNDDPFKLKPYKKNGYDWLR